MNGDKGAQMSDKRGRGRLFKERRESSGEVYGTHLEPVRVKNYVHEGEGRRGERGCFGRLEPVSTAGTQETTGRGGGRLYSTRRY